MSTFCLEHGISRKTFYELRRRVLEEGPAAALEPRSRRPRESPTRIGEEVKQQAVDVRASLEASGLDHGPISVFEKMTRMGLRAPSVASLARIFREKGLARLEPKKRPRSAWRRFVYPAPNACWQLDATEYVLAGGGKCAIFQLIDDHSRLSLASHVATGETSQGALSVVRKAITAHGVPQRFLSDNGTALNPTRRGWQGQLVSYLTSLGVEPITGKPGRPTTQGKNERFHQTLFRWLDKQPLATSIQELQQHVDQFDLIYNTERPHQGLPGRLTPAQAWAATAAVESPQPPATPPTPTRPRPPSPTSKPNRAVFPPQGQRDLTIRSNGAASINGTSFLVSYHHASQQIRAIWDPKNVTFIDNNGEILAEYPWPPPRTRYLSHHRTTRQQPPPQASPMS